MVMVMVMAVAMMLLKLILLLASAVCGRRRRCCRQTCVAVHFQVNFHGNLVAATIGPLVVLLVLLATYFYTW